MTTALDEDILAELLACRRVIAQQVDIIQKLNHENDALRNGTRPPRFLTLTDRGTDGDGYYSVWAEHGAEWVDEQVRP